MAKISTCLSIFLFIFKFKIKSVKNCVQNFMIFKIYLKQNLRIVFGVFFGLIKALMFAWFIIIIIIPFLQIIKNRICIKLNACSYLFL